VEFTRYIGSKKVKHAIIYTWSKYACQDLQEPKEDTIWTKYKEYQEGTPKCDMQENCPNYIKTQINTWLRKIPNERYIKEWDNWLPKRERFQQIDQTLYTFYDGTKYQDKKVCLSTRHVIGLKHQFKIDQVAIEDK
jgi:hypothetical protein